VIDDRGFERTASFDLGQHWTWSFREGGEASRAIRIIQRMSVLVQHNDRRSADQKTPVASDAVVEPRLLAKQRAIAHRPDNKLVPEARCTPLGAESVALPKLHGKRDNAFSGPTGNPAELQNKSK